MGAKGAKGAKGKGGEGGTPGGEVPLSLGLWMARARAVGALIGFAIAFLVCRRAGLPVADAALRGLLGALGLWLVAWWCALTVVTALAKTAAVQREERARQALEAARATSIPIE